MHRPNQQNSHIFDIHLHHFDDEVLQRSYQVPVLVDFWADWCGPCHAIAPNLTRAVEEFDGRVLLAKLEVDEGDNMKIAGHYRVRGFPTVILFRNGEAIDRFSSARPLQFIREFLEQHID